MRFDCIELNKQYNISKYNKEDSNLHGFCFGINVHYICLYLLKMIHCCHEILC